MYGIVALGKSAGGDALAVQVATQVIVAFVVAGLVEESLKYALVALYPGYQPIMHVFGVVLLGAAGALGFSIIENAAYILTALHNDGVNAAAILALLRALLSSPLHMATGALVASRVAERIMIAHHRQAPPTCFALRALWLPIVVHGTFDLFVFFMAKPPTTDADTRPTLQFMFLVFATLVAITLFMYVAFLVWATHTRCHEFEREIRGPRPPVAESAPLMAERRTDDGADNDTKSA